MAEQSEDNEKSEDPTQKRLDDALERGDVAKSQEVSTWFVLAGGTLMLAAFSGSMGTSLKGTLAGLIANAHQIPADGAALVRLSSRIGSRGYRCHRDTDPSGCAVCCRRQRDPAPAGLVDRKPEAQVLENLSGRRA